MYLDEIALVRNDDIELDSATVLVQFCNNVTVRNSYFFDNIETPIELIHSTIYFYGYTFFEENTARRGGGFSLINSN